MNTQPRKFYDTHVYGREGASNKQTIRGIITAYWKFDDNQQPQSNWHDREDLIEIIENYTTTPTPQDVGGINVLNTTAQDMTAKEYFTGEGSPLTLDNICTPDEKEFLLEHIDLYAMGKVRCATTEQQGKDGS